MIKSVNQLVTYECNSRCKMCLIWTKGKDPLKMSAEEFDSFYSRPEFKSVVDLCISGGEPTMRDDLNEVTEAITRNLPHLDYLFLSTNCSRPERALQFLEVNAKRAKEVYVCVSLEGDRNTHLKIRGVDSYDRVLDTLRGTQGLKIDNVKAIISSTIQPENANLASLEHIAKVASDTGSTYSFRPVMLSNTFYANGLIKKTDLSPEQEKLLLDYMEKCKGEDPFMHQLRKHMTGEKTVMGDKESGIECLAGEISVFIKSDGTMYPCINSTRVIGDKTRGLFGDKYKLGDKEGCPCCTECQIYPMLNYGGRK